MNCLFWNVGKQKINNYLLNVVVENDLHLLSLAEYEDDKNELIAELSVAGYDLFYVPKIGCKRIDLFTIYKPGKIEHLTETSYYTIKRVPHAKFGSLLFAFVHFPSKLYMNDLDYMEESRNFIRDVEEAEKNSKTNLTVLTGDFNMNPFEPGMLSAAAIHSYPTKYEARKQKKTIKGRTYNMFYNPMWSFFGDISKTHGTYYYSAARQFSLYWNMFDQVLVRPSLIDSISPKDIRILTSISEMSLVDKKGKPNVSDHLPLFFSIN